MFLKKVCEILGFLVVVKSYVDVKVVMRFDIGCGILVLNYEFEICVVGNVFDK